MGVDTKVSLIKQSLGEIKKMCEEQVPYREIVEFLNTKYREKFSISQLHSVLRQTGVINETSRLAGKLTNISMTPEQYSVLGDEGEVKVLLDGHIYLIECKHWCCKKLKNYGRYRGKLVMKFKHCPFCGAKR